MDILTIGMIAIPTIVILIHYKYTKDLGIIKEILRRMHEETESVEERLLADGQMERKKIEDLLHEIDELRKEIETLQREKQIESDKENDNLSAEVESMRKEVKDTVYVAIERLYKIISGEVKGELSFDDLKEEKPSVSEAEEEKYVAKKEEIITEAKKEEIITETEESPEIEEEIPEKESEEVEEEIIPEKELEEAVEKTEVVEEIIEESIPAEESTPYIEENSQGNENNIVDKFISEFKDLVEMDGRRENKDYFTADSLDKGDDFKCEIAFVNENKLFALDLKAHILIEEFGWQGDDGDNTKLAEEINSYVKTITNPQYLDSVIASMPSDIKYDDAGIIIALKNYEQVDIFKRIQEDFDFAKFNIEVKIFNDVNDIFL